MVFPVFVVSISRFLYSDFQFTEKIFSGLVAYVGEIIKSKLPYSMWELKQYKGDVSVWEPYIIKGTDKYNPFFCVYKEVYEDFLELEKIHLTESVLMIVGNIGSVSD